MDYFSDSNAIWLTGLQTLTKFGESTVLEAFLNSKLVPYNQKVLEDNDSKEETIANLALVTISLLDLCNFETWINYLASFMIDSEDSKMSLKDTNFMCVITHLEPKLSCFQEDPELPALWPLVKVQFFTKVTFSQCSQLLYKSLIYYITYIRLDHQIVRVVGNSIEIIPFDHF